MALIRNGPVDILRYLPDFLAKDKNFKLLHDCESREHERLRLALNDLFTQFFIPIAGERGIEKWEKIIGLIPRADADLEARRRAVLLWLQSNQVSTVEFMRRLAARYYPADANVQIEEHNEEYYFRILADGFPVDYKGLWQAVEMYKPAHLGYGLHVEIKHDFPMYIGAKAIIHKREIADIRYIASSCHEWKSCMGGTGIVHRKEIAPADIIRDCIADGINAVAGCMVIRSHIANHEPMDVVLAECNLRITSVTNHSKRIIAGQ